MSDINKAINLHKIGLLDEAEKIYKNLLSNFNYQNHKSEILQLLGALNLQKRKYNISKKYLEESLSLDGYNPMTLNNLGLVEKKLGDKKKSKDYFNLNIKKNYFVDSFINLIEILLESNEIDAAEKLTIEAAKKHPDNSRIKITHALIFFKNGKVKESIELFKKFIDKKDINIEAYYNYAVALFRTGSQKEALFYINKYISINSQNVNALYLRHTINKYFKSYNDAGKDLIKAIKINKSFKFKSALVKLHMDINDYDQAHSYCCEFLKEETEDENCNYFISKKIICELLTGNWENISEKDNNFLYQEFLKSKDAVQPMDLISITDDPDVLRDFSNFYWNKQLKKYVKFNQSAKLLKKPNKKIRVGFFSGDYRNHAVTHLIKDLFLNFDKSKFEIFGYSYYLKEGFYRDQIKSHFNSFYDLDHLNYQKMLDLICSHDLDFAIDLSGYTNYNQSWLFNYPIAKIKINYLGYPGTMGTNCYDYILADEHIIPKDKKKYYGEKEVVYMPETYQPFSIIEFDKDILKRKDFNLPEDLILLTSFSRIEKILPNMFEIWMRILNKYENTRLVLYQKSPLIRKSIEKFCLKKNFKFESIIFVESLPHKEHLKRLSLCDLYLDSFPYNSHTVLSDALFHSGIPAVSLVGNSFASRVSLSLLNYANLNEYAVFSRDDYFLKISSLIENANKLKSLKSSLRSRSKILSSRMIKFTKDFENILINLLDV